MAHVSNVKEQRLSNRDLDFLIDTVYPGITDRFRLKQIIREQEDFRNEFISDEKVFRRLMDDREIFVKISPTLFFEILLRKAAHDLEKVGYTFEKMGNENIPVFDAQEVVRLLTITPFLHYLADMLSSFTRIENYTISFQLREGIWETVRFNDLDLLSLMSFAEVVDEEYRLGFYKRIADICLFTLGIFPEYAERVYRYPFSGQVRPQFRGKVRIGPDEYEKEGRRFYGLAAGHPSAKELGLADVFGALQEDFQKAKKPLNFIAVHYLQFKKQALFG